MFLLAFAVTIFLLLLQDWLVLENRGRVQPDNADDTNPPVITGPEDASAQRLADLYTKKKS